MHPSSPIPPSDDPAVPPLPPVLPPGPGSAAEYAVFTLSPVGMIASWTPEAERQTGHAAEEMLGVHFRLFYSPADRAAGLPERLLDRAAQAGYVVDEGRRIRRDGTPFNAKLILAAFRDTNGALVGFSAVRRDLTELQRIQEQLSTQATMLEQAHDAIILYDLAGRITLWNHGATRLLGWTAAEAVGCTVRELFHALDHPTLLAAIAETSTQGSWQGELQIHNKAGSPLTFATRRSLVRTPDGRVIGQLSINLDLTEKKHLEAQFMRAQRMESIGILAGGIAHDLNNILAPILMSIALLKLKMPDHEGVQKQLDQLAANAQRGASLVKQVLSFGRGVDVQHVLMQPKHIGREIEQIVADTFPKNITFELSFSHDLWPVTGDPTQFHQVLLNLCVNARDAMPGGGKLTLHLENVVLDDSSGAPRPGPYVRTDVTDTGTGIPPENRERIFEPFFTTKDLGRGTGLGLSTSRAIAKSHGGFITVDSTVGHGTTFHVFLPADPGPAPTLPELNPTHHDLPRGQNELILIVDDEEMIREIARSALEKFGYRALLAQNGTEAVALYALHRTDIAVVITDMAMPVMDGPATILALRTLNPAVKIIGSSGQGAGSLLLANAPENAGLTYFIPKPYTAETLLRTLSTVLSRDSRPPLAP